MCGWVIIGCAYPNKSVTTEIEGKVTMIDNSMYLTKNGNILTKITDIPTFLLLKDVTNAYTKIKVTYNIYNRIISTNYLSFTTNKSSLSIRAENN